MQVSVVKKAKQVEIIKPQSEARQKFASHVQSIAFNLTLSRRMIDCLQAVRDYGWPRLGEDATKEERDHEKSERTIVQRFHHRGSKDFITNNFVGFMRSLDQRGLIVWRTQQHLGRDRKKGEKLIVLSRAGELVCALLVEAGLMEPESKKRD